VNLARLVFVLLLCLLLPACASKITKANFDKIKEGMTLEEVEKLLGKGTKDEGGDGSGVAAQFGVALPQAPTSGNADKYNWESGGKSISVYFRQGKMVTKQASGF
jgi:hypothetical protein